MNKIKFLFLFAIIVSLAFTACKTEEPENPDDNNTDIVVPPDSLPALTVSFNNMPAWNVQYFVGDITENSFYCALYQYPFANDFPFVFLQIIPTLGVTSIDENNFNHYLNNNSNQYIEYFEDNLIEDNYGDWWVQSGKISISKLDLDNKTISAVFDLVMFDAYDRYVNHNESYQHANMQIVINNIKFDNIDKNNSVTKR